jgi:ATP-dependent DNA helicase Q4
LTSIVGSASVRRDISLQAKRNVEGYKVVSDLLSTQWKDVDGVICYVQRQDQTESLASHLRTRGISAGNYHAGIPHNQKIMAHNDFLNSKIRVLVATVAYGMGIDKPNVRGVIHFGMPKSVESYVQEIGRAGRDGQGAQAMCFFGNEYVKFRSWAFAHGVDEQVLRELIDVIWPDDCEAVERQVCLEVLDAKQETVLSLVTYLSLRGHLKFGQTFPTRVKVQLINSGMQDLIEKEEWFGALCEFKTDSVRLDVPIFHVAQALELAPHEVMSKLYSLKARRQVVFEAIGMSVVVSPESLDDKGQVVQYLLQKTGRLETIRVGKVDQVFKLMTTISEGLNGHTWIQDYFEKPSEEKKYVSRWGFQDAALVQEQKDSLPEFLGILRNFLHRYTQFKTGRQVARIFHGIDSPHFPESEWKEKEPDIWSKYQHWNFREIIRLARESNKGLF